MKRRYYVIYIKFMIRELYTLSRIHFAMFPTESRVFRLPAVSLLSLRVIDIESVTLNGSRRSEWHRVCGCSKCILNQSHKYARVNCCISPVIRRSTNEMDGGDLCPFESLSFARLMRMFITHILGIFTIKNSVLSDLQSRQKKNILNNSVEDMTLES